MGPARLGPAVVQEPLDPFSVGSFRSALARGTRCVCRGFLSGDATRLTEDALDASTRITVERPADTPRGHRDVEPDAGISQNAPRATSVARGRPSPDEPPPSSSSSASAASLWLSVKDDVPPPRRQIPETDVVRSGAAIARGVPTLVHASQFGLFRRTLVRHRSASKAVVK